jgi:hypothetical protein
MDYTIMPMIRNRRRTDDKVPQYTHSKWELDYKGIKAECAPDGKITLTEEHSDGTYDEIVIRANMVFRMADMLNASKTIKFVDRKSDE